MIDESTNVSVISHIMVFAYFVEDGLHGAIFFGVIQIEDEKKRF